MTTLSRSVVRGTTLLDDSGDDVELPLLLPEEAKAVRLGSKATRVPATTEGADAAEARIFGETLGLVLVDW